MNGEKTFVSLSMWTPQIKCCGSGSKFEPTRRKKNTTKQVK